MGGTATNFYGIKLRLFKVYPKHGFLGINKKAVVLDSFSSHYSHRTGVNWLGMGEKNLIKVKSNFNQTTNLVDLELKMDRLLKKNVKIAAIICQGGTTSNLAIDNVKEIFKIRNRLIKKYSLNYSPHLHLDSVSGWIYLVFKDYDFKINKFGFSPLVIKHIRKKLFPLLLNFNFADSFGVDFHKTGYCPYVSSFFLIKNKEDIACLLKDKSKCAPLFQNFTEYNPGLYYTMETSRSSANMISTWLTIVTLGLEGYQLLIGNCLENATHFRFLFKQSQFNELVIINPDFFGTDIYLRYSDNSQKQNIKYYLKYKQEYPKKIIEIEDKLTKEFFDFLNSRYVSKFIFSLSSGVFYVGNGIPVKGIRIYFLNTNTEFKDVDELINLLRLAINEYNFRRHDI